MIRKLLFLIFATALFAACDESDSDSFKITFSQNQVLLGSETGSGTTVTVTANSPWTLTTTDEGFTVSPTSGGKGKTDMVITASSANTDRSSRMLGTIGLHKGTGAESYWLLVMQRSRTAPQTMLLYMPGQSLMSFYDKNIDGIKAAVTASMPGEGRIMVCYQPSGNSRAELSEIYFDTERKSPVINTIRNYTSFNASNPANVAQLFADVTTLAPAHEYGLIIGCHGKAWIPASAGSLRPKSAGEDQLWTPMPGALLTRSFGDTGREMEMSALSEAMMAANFHPDYLIFDACFMANIETLYDLRKAVKRVIASPCEIMAAGFPYKRTIPYMFTDNGTGDDMAEVCNQFWRFYMYDWNTIQGNEQSGCISLAVCSELDALAEIMRRINAAPKKAYDLRALQSYEGFTNHGFFDLKHYVESSCADAALIEEFNRQLDKAFPKDYRLNTPSFYSAYNNQLNPVTNYSGVSTSAPSVNTQIAPIINQTAWYRATH